LWSPGGGVGTTENNLAPGSYTVTVADASGCTSTAVAIVPPTSAPVASVSPDITIISGGSTQLTATGGGIYNWIPSSGLSCAACSNPFASPFETTTYCVEVTDVNGCRDTACVTITVETPCRAADVLGVPNAFSPNNDAINDEFCLLGWDACLIDFQILIFDRWGERVFKSNDPNFCWDGTYLEKKMDSAVFVYFIKAVYIDSKDAVLRKGNISLLR